MEEVTTMRETGPSALSRFRLATRVIAVAFVLALLGLLIADLVRSNGGADLVKKVEKGERPQAPPFWLQVVWGHDETWPLELRRRLDDGRLGLAELRDLADRVTDLYRQRGFLLARAYVPAQAIEGGTVEIAVLRRSHCSSSDLSCLLPMGVRA